MAVRIFNQLLDKVYVIFEIRTYTLEVRCKSDSQNGDLHSLGLHT